jgi:hypothetical protein
MRSKENKTMPNTCGECKANPIEIARNTSGTPTAKLIAILVAHGITDTKDLAEITGLKVRAVQTARAASASAADCAQLNAPVSASAADCAQLNAPVSASAAHCAQYIAPAQHIAPEAQHIAPLARVESNYINNITPTKQTNSREREVGSSEASPEALKQAFNGATENLIGDIQRWMQADRKHAANWLTTTLTIAGADAVLTAYRQLLEKQAKGDLVADPIRYLGKTARSLKDRVAPPASDTAVHQIDGKPFKVTGVRYAKPREEVAHA